MGSSRPQCYAKGCPAGGATWLGETKGVQIRESTLKMRKNTFYLKSVYYRGQRKTRKALKEKNFMK